MRDDLVDKISREIEKSDSDLVHRIVKVRVQRIIDDDPDMSWLKPDSGRYSDVVDPEERNRCESEDAERLAGYPDKWYMTGVGVYAVIECLHCGQKQRVDSSFLWSVESDVSKDYFETVIEEELSKLDERLRRFGFNNDDIQAAFEGLDMSIPEIEDIKAFNKL